MRFVRLSTAAIFAGLLALAGFASACTTVTTASAGSAGLDGTWRLVEVASQPVQGGQARVPYFTVDGSEISGFDGCNQFWGSLDKPLSIGATRMGCPPAVLRLPLDLEDAGAHLAAATIDNDRLQLPARGRFPASVYIRTEE